MELFSALASGSYPTMLYTVYAEQTSRSANSVTYSVTCWARLDNQTYDYFGALVYPKINIGGTTASFAALGTFPKGAGAKFSTISVTVSGISAATSSLSYTFSATSQLGGTSSSTTGYVGGKSGTVPVSVYATTPSLGGTITIKDGSTVVSSYYRENLGTGSFNISWPSATGANGTLVYELQRSINGQNWTIVNSAISGTSINDAPGAGASSVRYAVLAKNRVGTDEMMSGFIYSPTVNKNELKSPSLTSSANVTYNTRTFVVTLGAASDNLGSSISYTISGISSKYTTINGTTSVPPGNITINANNGTGGTYMTLANLKAAALNGAAHSDTNPYKGTIDLQVTATNGKGSSKTETVAIPINLGIDAPVNGTPSVSIAAASYYTINSVNYIFPEYKPVSLSIPGAIKDMLGRNCSYDIVMVEGNSQAIIKNTGIVTAATTATVNHVESGLLTSKKNVSFYVRAQALGNEGKSSAETPKVDLHYYKKPSVTSSDLSRIVGKATFKVNITPNTSLTGSTNTSTMPSGYTKGTSTITSGVESYTVTSSTTLADSYTATISVVVRDSIGYILSGSNDVTLKVTIPTFTPALSIRERGVGINGFAGTTEKLYVGGNVKLTGNLIVGGIIDMGNTNIENVNHITITDPGGGEGLEWKDPTNNWKIVVAPDNLGNATGDLQFARNGVRRATVRANGEVAAVGGFATTNPSNTAASVSLNFLNNIARLRTGGTGAGADNGFEIHGTGDIVRWKVDGAGNVSNYGDLRVYNGKQIQFMNSSGMAMDGYGNIKPRDPASHAPGASWWVSDVKGTQIIRVNTGSTGGFGEMIGRPFTQVTAFTNGWQDYGSFGPVAYTKDAAGFVVLQGLLRGNSGTSGSAFQLPAGFRPSTTRIFSAVNGVNGHSRIDINADGTVVMQGGAPDFCSLNGIRFLAA
ncbi:hypothetical protein P4493_10940 [Bacillus thuringiensis]|uniref:Uncharacterized protein n=2 Tax=Bacillus thuringiensis TaxID=1428 RepID=A0AB35PDP8_BACTU|nr:MULTISPECIES: hypothetical protein [Bacillus]MEC3434414.1 hypothetical protein [Bacillus cereus]AJH02450.1 hypothetical protein AS86_6733 [Bacillus thuringiensis HD1002]AND28417.1 hypothetical protein ATN07_32320 [Bacillus thuringiensis serovar israelensis]EXL36669.1 hypothetical protein BG78_22825 [Bacillus thuringiensis serovar israelensis]KAA8486615.1 hypothetical protein FYW98_18600 [Bacillus thuringiensis]